MDLKWPWLLIPMVAAIGAALWLARRRSHRGWQGELPLLARSFRLTELPEYQRAIRLHQRLSAAALVFAIVVVTALLGSTLRPTYTYHPQPADPDTPFVDIMLCFAPFFGMYSAGELGMVPLMTDLRAQVNEFGNQRIGMTTEFYRAFPVTADRRWVSERLGEIIDVTQKAVKDPPTMSWPPTCSSATDTAVTSSRTSPTPSRCAQWACLPQVLTTAAAGC